MLFWLLLLYSWIILNFPSLIKYFTEFLLKFVPATRFQQVEMRAAKHLTRLWNTPPRKTPDCSTSTIRMVAANFLRYFNKGRTFVRSSANFENNIKDCRERRTNRDSSLMSHRQLAYCQHASLIDKIKRRAVPRCWCRSLLLWRKKTTKKQSVPLVPSFITSGFVWSTPLSLGTTWEIIGRGKYFYTLPLEANL